MKKIIIIMIAVISLSFLNIEKIDAQESAPIQVNMVFGRKSLNCEGFGICKFYAKVLDFVFSYNWDDKGLNPANYPSLSCTVNEANKTFTLTGSVANLQDKASGKVSSLNNNEKFYLEEDIPFPTSVNSALNLNSSKQIILKKGEYSVKKTGDVYKIVIDIK